MAADVGVLLPLRIETRFRDGDLHLRVVPDEPWFVRHDARISRGELIALRRYISSGARPAAGPPPAAWRELAAQVGAARAVYLHRTYVTDDGASGLHVRPLNPGERREEPALPRIVGFPTALRVYLATGGNAPRPVLDLSVKPARLLADFADPDLPGDRRWWQDWDEALKVGVAGIIPAAQLGEPIDTLYVIGIGDTEPGQLFPSLAAEGRLGLIAPGTPTNSVDGGAAAPLHNDADTWWRMLRASRGPDDAELSTALTGDRRRLGTVPGGQRSHRRDTSACTSVLWPALWGFAAGHVYDLARGAEPARWAQQALYPEGPYPTLRIGPQPYALLPATRWQRWSADPHDPPLEAPLINAVLHLRPDHADAARSRGTVTGQTAQQLLELLAHTPTSTRLWYRPAWPLQLWWLAATGSAMETPWHEFVQAWEDDHPLAALLGLHRARRYGARGQPKPLHLPLIVPDSVDPVTEFPQLIRQLAAAAVTSPATFADTAGVDTAVLGRPADSLLLRLIIRSLQLLIAEVARTDPDDRSVPDPEPLLRRNDQPGRLQELIAGVAAIDTNQPGPAVQHLLDVTADLNTVAAIPAADLDRMVRASVDTANHRIDPWFVAVAQRRLDTLHQDPQTRYRLGAYGWVDNLLPGNPGPTAGGLVQAPSPGQALTAAVLRDRAITTTDNRWDLDITSRRARIAYRIAEHVRVGADLSEALGREVERVVGATASIERLRRDFPVRAEHVGRRVCDGLAVLRVTNLPVPLNQPQRAQIAELRDAVDVYGDLLVAEAVHHLTEGRSDIAGAVMDAAAGLSRPPELALLRTPRQGRSVSTSAVILLRHENPAEVPDNDEAVQATRRPSAVLDASAARFLTVTLGRATDWDFLVDRLDPDGVPVGAPETVTLADLNVPPADALALTRTDLDRLARERIADPLELPPGGFAVVGGTATSRYEAGVRLTSLLGRTPAGSAAAAETDGADDAPALLASLVRRFLDVRAVGEALVAQLTARLAPAEFSQINQQALNRLVQAARCWGIAPEVTPADLAGPASTAVVRLRRVAVARHAVTQLEERLRRAPATAAAARELGRDRLLEAATALVSPTGHLTVTGELHGAALPPLVRGESAGAAVDEQWLTVVSAVRPRLAALEAHQLTADRPLAAWTNRPDDLWQRNPADPRRLVTVYAHEDLDLREIGPEDLYAVVALDRFTEVIPAAEQLIGAAFGFDAPASRAPQAILLAVPPATGVPLDQETLVRIVAETRDLAHARMARPVDLPAAFRGLAPSSLLPATGSTATPLETS
ncbi:hypothetical protein OG426_09855 [Streptomyces canus]|uniref:hypothetical protein n=1 Tax=Streptomyces canus TaxID=58343 RepID=UPI003862FBD4|nr:hypothetical protein OG426_09855 [Streptomyces canus]